MYTQRENRLFYNRYALEKYKKLMLMKFIPSASEANNTPCTTITFNILPQYFLHKNNIVVHKLIYNMKQHTLKTHVCTKLIEAQHQITVCDYL